MSGADENEKAPEPKDTVRSGKMKEMEMNALSNRNLTLGGEVWSPAERLNSVELRAEIGRMRGEELARIATLIGRKIGAGVTAFVKATDDSAKIAEAAATNAKIREMQAELIGEWTRAVGHGVSRLVRGLGRFVLATAEGLAVARAAEHLLTLDDAQLARIGIASRSDIPAFLLGVRGASSSVAPVNALAAIGDGTMAGEAANSDAPIRHAA